jgi:hypothetical protein
VTGLILPDAGGLPDTFVGPCHPALIQSANTNTANTLIGCRVIVPKSGQLRDLAVYIQTQAGNLIGVVYDTGDALAASRTKLWDSGSVAAAASGSWQILGDPNLAVTKGQQLDIGVANDNGAAAFGRVGGVATSSPTTLPSAFWAAPGGATPKLGWRHSPGSFIVPATIAEASLAAIASVFFVMARIS